MNSKFVLILSFLALIGFSSNAQQYEPAYSSGVEIGAIAFIGKQNAPDMLGLHKSFTTAYFGDLRSGFRTGLSYSSDFENCNNAFLVPIYFARRNKPTVSKEPIIIDTFGDLIFGLLSSIIPSRVEYNIGPTIGYIQQNSNPIFDDEYRVRREMFFSINAGVRPSFQIWRLNLGFNFNIGYVPTKNFRYYSTNTFYNGTTSNWMVNMGGFLTYAFDL